MSCRQFASAANVGKRIVNWLQLVATKVGAHKWTAPEINRTTHRSKRKNIFNYYMYPTKIVRHGDPSGHMRHLDGISQHLPYEYNNWNKKMNEKMVLLYPDSLSRVNGCIILHRNKTKQISCIVLTTGSCKIGSTTLTSNRFLLCSVIGICHYSVVLKERTQDFRGRANAR